jgi:hypothetical protein
MAWVKLDDQFPDHPKVIEAGPEAAWLYVAALCYSSAKLTDGAIPTALVGRLTAHRGGERLAERLVAVGLWERAPSGYQVHDYGDYQPSAAATRAKREAEVEYKRAAGKLGGVASGIARAKSKQAASTGEAETKQTASHVEEAETNPRPDPTPPASNEAGKSSSAPPPRERFDFEAVYLAYPRRKGDTGKKEGIEICAKQIKTRVDYDRLLDAVKRYAAERREDVGTSFIPMFPTWMRKRWTDIAEPVQGTLASVPDAIGEFNARVAAAAEGRS